METKNANSHRSIHNYSFILLVAVAVWALLILRFGYRYGTGDQVELLPYSLYLHNASLYANDFFIQNLHKSIPNERTVMANLLLPFVDNLEFYVLLFQFLSSVVLLVALQKIALLFIQNKYGAWFAVAVALIPLNDYTLGNVELYSECLQAGGLACAIIAWAFYFFLKRSYFLSGALLSIATFIQLLDGLDVMILLSTVLFFLVLSGKESWTAFLKFIILFSVTAFGYLLIILVKKSAGGEGLPTEDVFKIMFEFRHPHHFIFSSFPLLKTILFFLFWFIGVLHFFRKSKPIFYVLIFGLLGLLFYAFAVDVLHQVSIANFQFYKVSSWLKFFGVVAFVAIAFNTLPFLKHLNLSREVEYGLILFVPVACFVIITHGSNLLPYKVPYQFACLTNEDLRIDICKKIAAGTDSSAVFVQPFDFTELKFYGLRSCYVEFKANVRHKDAIGEWHRRIKEVYGVSAESDIKGFALQSAADAYYDRLDDIRIALLKKSGVTHLLISSGIIKGRIPLLSNSAYEVYQL